MILKTLTHDRGNSDCWNFYDNIISASVYYNEDIEECCVAVSFADEDGEIVLAVPDVAYLCNDKGETIEKLYKSKN